MEIWPSNQNQYWRLVTDAVMGGVSRGSIVKETLEGREAFRMRGDVSTENNGGFVQITLDLSPEAGAFDASAFTGLEMEVLGNQESYSAHLRTTDVTRPQQSYRQSLLRHQSGRPYSYRSNNSCRTESMFRSMSAG